MSEKVKTADAPSYADALVDKLVYGVVLKAAIKAIVGRVPFLLWPGINPLFVALVTKIAGMLYRELATFGARIIIHARVEGQKDAYVESLDKYKDTLEKGDEDAIEKARIQAEDRLAKLISGKSK